MDPDHAQYEWALKVKEEYEKKNQGKPGKLKDKDQPSPLLPMKPSLKIKKGTSTKLEIEFNSSMKSIHSLKGIEDEDSIDPMDEEELDAN